MAKNELQYGTDEWQAQLSEEEWMQQEAYRCLNNLYLELEQGIVEMSLHFRLKLEQLVMQAYPGDQMMIDWWHGEFQKLEGYKDF